VHLRQEADRRGRVDADRAVEAADRVRLAHDELERARHPGPDAGLVVDAGGRRDGGDARARHERALEVDASLAVDAGVLLARRVERLRERGAAGAGRDVALLDEPRLRVERTAEDRRVVRRGDRDARVVDGRAPAETTVGAEARRSAER